MNKSERIDCEISLFSASMCGTVSSMLSGLKTGGVFILARDSFVATEQRELSTDCEGSGTPRPKTISARDSSAQTIRPIFQSGTARPTLLGPLGPFFFYFIFFLFFFFFWGGGDIFLYFIYVL